MGWSKVVVLPFRLVVCLSSSFYTVTGLVANVVQPIFIVQMSKRSQTTITTLNT